jgi:hypothetical protein
MSKSLSYLCVAPNAELPNAVIRAPFRAVVIVEATVTPEWRAKASDWLVSAGCLYMMAWGAECSLWDDSVDWANIEQKSLGEIPEDRFVMTTWHEDEMLNEVFWQSKNCAFHSSIDIDNTLLLHISTQCSKEAMLRVYAEA